MKKYTLRAYFANGDAYHTVCTNGLDIGDDLTVEAETRQDAEDMILGMCDPYMISAVEADPDFIFWRAEEVQK